MIRKIAEKIKGADAILIGASNGLSITEGLHLFADDQAFEDLFGDLKAVIGEKDYFVVTSNGECHFEMCGFDPEKICEIEGNWLTMQCASGCHQKLYPVLELAEKMAAKEQGGEIPSELVPRCPECGGPMKIHMVGPNFIPPAAEKERLDAFLEKYHGKNLVILELGIGWRNQLIKAPLMRLTAKEPNAAYITINLGEVYIAEDIKEKSFGVDGYLDEALAAIKELISVSS